MAEKTTMNDVNEPIESKDSAPQEEKRSARRIQINTKSSICGS